MMHMASAHSTSAMALPAGSSAEMQIEALPYKLFYRRRHSVAHCGTRAAKRRFSVRSFHPIGAGHVDR
jgi:hypothetical protein